MKPYRVIGEDERAMYQTNRGSLIQAHIADIHFGVITPRVQYDILRDQVINVLYTLPILDIISIDGDLFDRKYMGDTDAISYATRFISDLVMLAKQKNSTIVIIAGTKSHDAGQLKLFYHYLTDPTVDVRIVETIQFEFIKGARILCIPELYGFPEEVYNEFLFHSGYYDMCFMHGTFKGAALTSNTKVFDMIDFTNCRGPIISGHVHTGGCFESYFYYTSSPLRWRHGEEQPKGFLIVMYDMDSGYHYTYMQEVKSFTYRTINLSDLINNNPDEIIHYINQIKERENIDFIRVQFDYQVDKSKMNVLNNYYKNDNTVKFKENIDSRSIVRESLSESDMMIYDKFSYLFASDLSPYDKLARYIVDKEPNAIYVTGECIKNILDDKF